MARGRCMDGCGREADVRLRNGLRLCSSCLKDREHRARGGDEGAASIVGLVLAVGIVSMMAAAMTPGLIEWAEAGEDLAEARAESRREMAACYQGDLEMCPVDGQKVKCWTNQTVTVNNTTSTKTECISQPVNDTEG